MATLENLWYLSGFPEGTLISGPICKLQDAGISILAVECMWWLSTWSTPRGGSQVSRHEELHPYCGMYVMAEHLEHTKGWVTSFKTRGVAHLLWNVCDDWVTSFKMRGVAHLLYVGHKLQDARSCTLTVECMWQLSTRSTPRGGSQISRCEELHPYCGMYVTAEHLEHTKGWVVSYKMRGVAHLLWNVCDGWALGAHQRVGHKLQDARSCTLAVEYIWRLSTQSTPRGWSQKCQLLRPKWFQYTS